MGTSVIRMTINMKANLNEERLTAKEFTTGLLERSLTENGKTGSKKATVSGKELTETLTSANGEIQKRMAMEFTHGRTATDTRENGTTA